MISYSDAKQDLFAYNILNKKTNGTYIDIGSCGSIGSNNSFLLETLGWNGICIEKDSSYNNQYRSRSCEYINSDALDIDYSKIFNNYFSCKVIDYASIDIDTLSYDVLIKLPLDEYKFNCITIEHDAYLHGDNYRLRQREVLLNKEYYLLFADVYVEQSGYEGKEYSFEDWWVNPSLLDEEYRNNITSNNIYPSEIIRKIQ